jgi:hypothetical protein
MSKINIFDLLPEELILIVIEYIDNTRSIPLNEILYPLYTTSDIFLKAIDNYLDTGKRCGKLNFLPVSNQEIELNKRDVGSSNFSITNYYSQGSDNIILIAGNPNEIVIILYKFNNTYCITQYMRNKHNIHHRDSTVYKFDEWKKLLTVIDIETLNQLYENNGYIL